jgi:hypothetical protein
MSESSIMTRLAVGLVAWLNAPFKDLPDPEESAFGEQDCAKCGERFDVPPDVMFDRRRGYYCEQCRHRSRNP